MSKEANAIPADSKDTSSGASDSQNTEVANESKDETSYNKAFVEKLKKEKDNWRSKAVELESKISKESEDKLREKEEFKKLAELKEKEAAQFKAEKIALEDKIRSGTINGAVKRELVKLGFDDSHSDDFFKLIGDSLKQVAIDPDTQTVIGAEDVAKQAHQKYAALGFFKKSSATVNHSASKTIDNVAPDLSKMKTAELVEYWKKIKKS